MRTVITAHDDRHVTIEFDDLINGGERIRLEMSAAIPRSGGSSYIRFADGRQVCSELSSRGATLSYRDGEKLVDIVRAEYRAMRATEKRYLQQHD